MAIKKEKEKINSEDTLLSLENILSYKIAPGDIFWVKKDQTKVQIRKAGDPIEEAYFNKFKKVKSEFSISEISRINFINDAVKMLQDLSHCSFEKEKWILRNQFIHWLNRNYMDESSQATQLEFMLVGAKAFLNLEVDIEHQLIEHSVALYRRAALSGMLAVSFALSLGYLDYRILQDLYHLYFLQDIYFVKEGGDFILNTALEEERLKSGSAQECLKNYGRGDKFLELIQHPEESVKLLQKSKVNFLHQIEMLDFIKLHHEKLDGSGFSNDVNGDELGDLEQIYIIVNYLSSQQDPDYDLKEGNNLLLKFLNKDGLNNFENRILSNIKNAFKTVSTTKVNEAS